MRTDVDVVVIGGGLAGATTARQLAKLGVDVVLLESRRVIDDKVCGEFLSHDAVASMARLGVAAAVAARGAVPIHEVLVTAGGASWRAPLPQPGIGLSRAQLDATLLEEASSAGVKVELGASARQVQRTGDHVTVVVAQGRHTNSIHARCVVGAFGRRGNLGATGRPLADTDGVGFKGHFTGLDLAGRVELHAFPGGYCGLAPVERGRTNVCLQVQASVLRANGGTYDKLCQHVLMRSAVLAERLTSLRPEQEQMATVAGLRSHRRAAQANDMVMIGDASATITPLCGDGMAMALRAAELLPPRLLTYLHGELSWEQLGVAFARDTRREFARRLLLGRAMEGLLIRPRLAAACLHLFARTPKIGATLIRWTRGDS